MDEIILTQARKNAIQKEISALAYSHIVSTVVNRHQGKHTDQEIVNYIYGIVDFEFSINERLNALANNGTKL